MTAFKDAQIQRAEDVETAAAVQRREQIKALIDQHIDDTKWRESLHQARQVAERGEKEYLLLRFPSELCTDNARAINNPPNPDWPKTLQGEAMELYARWRDQLSPRGFHLAARYLIFQVASRATWVCSSSGESSVRRLLAATLAGRSLRREFESCDWEIGHRGPRYWRYVKHGACTGW